MKEKGTELSLFLGAHPGELTPSLGLLRAGTEQRGCSLGNYFLFLVY